MIRSALRSWRTKAHIQRVLSALPGGTALNYLLQRRVTKGIPIPQEKLRRAVGHAIAHVEAYRRHGDGPPLDEATFFEFGAGWDLHIPITLFGVGVRTQIVVDLTAHARPRLVDDVAERLLDEPRLAAVDDLRRAAACARDEDTVVAKAACFGITYRAPADARATGLADGAVDCITSTSTLEHVPRDDLVRILAECRRVLSPDGAASFVIDYSDHYAHFDATVTPYNFLRFTDSQWRRYNASLHYQNRLRHHEYLELFRGAGFDVVHDAPRHVDAAALAALASVPLAPQFRAMTPEQVAITGAHVVLRSPQPT